MKRSISAAAYSLARAWAALGEEEQGEAYLRAALERRPDDAELHQLLARFLSLCQSRNHGVHE